MHVSIALDIFQRTFRPAMNFAQANTFLGTEEILEELQRIDKNVFQPSLTVGEDGTLDGSEVAASLTFDPITATHNWLASKRYVLQQLDGMKMVWLLCEV